MPKIPNSENVDVDERKLSEYVLNKQHPEGRHKAKVFESTLGLTQDDVDILVKALLDAALNNDAIIKKSDEYGQRYQIDFTLATDSGSAVVRSG